MLTTWGSEGSGDGQFNFIYGDPNHNLALGGVAVDEEGNVYVADGGNARIQKFDSEGNFLTKWGSLGGGDGQFTRPMDLTIDQDTNIYVIDDRSSPRGRIQKFDSEGNLYVVDVYNGRLQKLDSNGNFLFKWGRFREPYGVRVDGEGNIYISDYPNDRIQKYRLTTTPP